MKVALVCPYDLGRPGGVQDQVEKLARWLEDEGDEVVVVGPGEEGPEGAVLLGSTVVLRANASAAPVRLDPRAGERVAEAVADCDVVHVHEPLMPMVSLGAMRRVARPMVATFHAAPSPMMRRLYAGGRRAVRALVGRAAVVTAVSPVAAQVVPEGVPVRLVPNGVDLDVYPARPRDPLKVVFLGRNDPRKGLDVLLTAWPAVRRAVPAAQLVVMGVADPGGTPAGVHFRGRVSEEEKRATLAESGVLCAPNLSGESFGIILAEGMAAGCAVVASALPGFVHVAGDAAVLTKPGDVDGVASSLTAVLSDDARAAQLREQSLDRVQRFGRETVLAAYRTCYHDALRA